MPNFSLALKIAVIVNAIVLGVLFAGRPRITPPPMIHVMPPPPAKDRWFPAIVPYIVPNISPPPPPPPPILPPKHKDRQVFPSISPPPPNLPGLDPPTVDPQGKKQS